MPGYDRLFVDRADAGRQLAQALAERRLEDPIVYALPRGGVPVAVEIAKALEAPLDLLMVRKIGAPGSPELALAAVVDGQEAQTVVNEEVKAMTGADQAYLDEVRAHELEEIERRRRVYLDGRGRLSPKGRTAIVADDGLATGATAKAALRALKRQDAKLTVLAVPVAPVETLAEMRGEADEIVCLNPAEWFWGVGGFYQDFHQLDDAETRAFLAKVWTPGQRAAPPP